MRLLWTLPLFASLFALGWTLWPRQGMRPAMPALAEVAPESSPAFRRARVPAAIVSNAREIIPNAPAMYVEQLDPIIEPSDADAADSESPEEEETPPHVENLDLGLDPNGRRWTAVVIGEEGSGPFVVEVACDERPVLNLPEIWSRWGVGVEMAHWPDHHFARVTCGGGCGCGNYCSSEDWYEVTPWDGNTTAVVSFLTSSCSEGWDRPFNVQVNTSVESGTDDRPAFTLKWDIQYDLSYNNDEEWLEQNPLSESERAALTENTALGLEGTTRYVWDASQKSFVPGDDQKQIPDYAGCPDDLVLQHTELLCEWTSKCAWSRNWLQMVRTKCEDEKAIALIDEMLR